MTLKENLNLEGKDLQRYRGRRNYANGARKERQIVKKEKLKGNTAFRSAGSHSPIDVVSIDPIARRIYLYQSKPKSMNEAKRKEIKEKNMFLNGFYQVEFLVV